MPSASGAAPARPRRNEAPRRSIRTALASARTASVSFSAADTPGPDEVEASGGARSEALPLLHPCTGSSDGLTAPIHARQRRRSRRPDAPSRYRFGVAGERLGDHPRDACCGRAPSASTDIDSRSLPAAFARAQTSSSVTTADRPRRASDRSGRRRSLACTKGEAHRDCGSSSPGAPELHGYEQSAPRYCFPRMQ
jgi:hypothetical protein